MVNLSILDVSLDMNRSHINAHLPFGCKLILSCFSDSVKVSIFCDPSNLCHVRNLDWHGGCNCRFYVLNSYKSIHCWWKRFIGMLWWPTSPYIRICMIYINGNIMMFCINTIWYSYMTPHSKIRSKCSEMCKNAIEIAFDIIFIAYKSWWWVS